MSWRSASLKYSPDCACEDHRLRQIQTTESRFEGNVLVVCRQAVIQTYVRHAICKPHDLEQWANRRQGRGWWSLSRVPRAPREFRLMCVFWSHQHRLYPVMMRIVARTESPRLALAMRKTMMFYLCAEIWDQACASFRYPLGVMPRRLRNARLSSRGCHTRHRGKLPSPISRHQCLHWVTSQVRVPSELTW